LQIEVEEDYRLGEGKRRGRSAEREMEDMKSIHMACSFTIQLFLPSLCISSPNKVIQYQLFLDQFTIYPGQTAADYTRLG
jgi:hypothetical protein